MYKTIAIAVSGHGREANHIAHGLALARALKARLRIVHVAASSLMMAGYAMGHFVETPVERDDPCRSEGCLEGYVREYGFTDLDEVGTTYEVVSGDCIERLASLSGDVDLLVLGHHHAGIMEWFGRSDDERVLGRSDCPVLIVPEM